MNPRSALKVARFLTLVFWAIIIINFFVPLGSPQISTWISYIGIGAFLIHILEIVIFSKRLKIQKNSGKSLRQALIFGMFEIITWRKKAL